MPSYAEARRRQANAAAPDPAREYVLYWMQTYRRLDHNHALDFAAAMAAEWGKPLVVYEGLRLDYPWASDRFHAFLLEGMRDNAEIARQHGINYWPFVQTPDQPAAGLLAKLAARACLVVTDDFPCFITPRQTAALARRADVAVTMVDSNSIVPLRLLGAPVSMAAHLRPRIHKAFADAWRHRAVAEPSFPAVVRRPVDPPFSVWDVNSELDKFLSDLPIDHSVGRLPNEPGGPTAAKHRLRRFLDHRLSGYAEHRSQPEEPDQGHASCLSGYLHFGHISIEEVVEAVLASRGDWDVSQLNAGCRGKREGFYHPNADVNSFLDEAITWRDVGYHWHAHRSADAASLETALPPWAWTTLSKHAADRRDYVYTPEQWEAADTHDELWNAAQRELVHTGRIHNYMRMLWGKKVLEWSQSPEEAYQTLEHLNNKYAIDGRDPNSYTGILWCFGLFDRPWPPERNVFGSIRYMSSANTAKKFRLSRYLNYTHRLTQGSS